MQKLAKVIQLYAIRYKKTFVSKCIENVCELLVEIFSNFGNFWCWLYDNKC